MPSEAAKLMVTEVLAEVRANIARLDGCIGPHDFSIDATPAKPLNKRWACTKCGGEVDSVGRRWYELGLKHAA